MTHAQSENPADLDRTDPEAEIGARAEAFRNWGRWGEDDVLGTLNFIDPRSGWMPRPSSARARSSRSRSRSTRTVRRRAGAGAPTPCTR